MGKITTIEELENKYPEAAKKAKQELIQKRNEQANFMANTMNNLQGTKIMANTVNAPYCEVNNSVKNRMCSYTQVPQNVRSLEHDVNLLVHAAESMIGGK